METSQRFHLKSYFCRHYYTSKGLAEGKGTDRSQQTDPDQYKVVQD